MKNPLENGERVRTPKKNKRQRRRSKDSEKKRTPQKERRRTSKKERRRTSKKERRRTSKKERRRTARKKRNQIYIKHGGEMEVDYGEFREIAEKELEGVDNIDMDKLKQKVKDATTGPTPTAYDTTYKERESAQKLKKQKEQEKEEIVKELAVAEAEVKDKLQEDSLEQPEEFDNKKISEAQQKVEELEKKRIDSSSGIPDYEHRENLKKKVEDELKSNLAWQGTSPVPQLEGNDEEDINQDIVKTIFKGLQVKKLNDKWIDVKTPEKVYYFDLNINSVELKKLFENISCDKEIPEIDEDEKESKFFTKDLKHIKDGHDKKVLKIPPYFIQNFIRLAINTRLEKDEYTLERLNELKRIIKYSKENEELDEANAKLKQLKEERTKTNDKAEKLKDALEKASEAAKNARDKISEIKKRLETTGGDIRNKESEIEKLKKEEAELVTQEIQKQIIEMQAEEARKKEAEAAAAKEAAEAKAREAAEAARRAQAEEEAREKERLLTKKIDDINNNYDNILEIITKIRKQFNETQEKEKQEEGTPDYSKIIGEYEQNIVDLKGQKSIFDSINIEGIDKDQRAEGIKVKAANINKGITDLETEINAALEKAIEVDKENLKNKSIYELDFFHDNLKSLDDEFSDKKYDEFYNLFETKTAGIAGEYAQSVQDLAKNLPNEWGDEQKGKTIRIKEKILRPFHKHISMILKLPFIRKLNGLTKSDIQNLKDEPFIVDRTIIGQDFFATLRDTGAADDEGVWKKWLNYIFDYLFVSPEVILSSSIKGADGEKLKEQLKTFNQKSSENSVRDTEIFSIDLLNEGPPEFHGTDPQAFHVKTLLNMVDELLKAETFGTFHKEKILILVPIIYNKYYYSRLNVDFEKVIENLEKYSANKPILDGLNEKIKANVGNNIVTYLKIRINNNSDVEPRFNFTFKGLPKGMRNKDAEEAAMSKGLPIKTLYLKYNADRNKVEKSEGWHSSPFRASANPRLHYDYIFGKFTEVFTSKHQPKEIAEKMSTDGDKTSALLNHIIEGKPIFILGYGASGAGKTSTLINYVPDDGERSTPGILIELCNRLGGSPHNYDKVTVKSKEYFAGINVDDTGYNQEILPAGVEPIEDLPDTYEKGLKLFNASVDTVNFEWKGRQFLLKKNEEYTNMFHKSRFDMHQVKSSQGQSNCPEVSDDGGNSCDQPGSWPDFKEKVFKTRNEQVELGSFIEFLVDKDRFVKATTNNPQSSRSHTLVYIELVNTTESISNKQLIEEKHTASDLDLEQDQMEIIKEKINNKKLKFNKDIDEVKTQLENIIGGLPRGGDGSGWLSDEEIITKLKNVGSEAETSIYIWYNNEGLEADTKEKGKELIENIKKYQKLIRDLDNYENSYSSEIPQKKAHLFVGDFAGVENAFQCNNVNVVKKMLGAAKGKVPFYSMNINAKGQQGGSLIPPAGKEMVKYDPTFSVIHDDKNNDWDITFIPREKNEYAREFIDFDKGPDHFYDYAKYYDLPKLKEKEKGEESHFNADSEFRFQSIKPIHYIIKKTLGIDEGSDTNINDTIYKTIYEGIKTQGVDGAAGADKYYEEIVKKLKEQNDKIKEEVTRMDTTTESLIQELKQKPEKFGFDREAMFGKKDEKVWPVSNLTGKSGNDDKDPENTSVELQKKIRNYYNDKYITSDEDVKRMFEDLRDPGAALPEEYTYLVSYISEKGGPGYKYALKTMYDAGAGAGAGEDPVEAMHKVGKKGSSKFLQGKPLFETINASVILQNIKEIELNNARNFTAVGNPYMDGLYKGVPEGQQPDLTEIKDPDKYEYNYNIINRILKTIIKRLAFGNKICNNRLIEGKYINQSLANVRNTINDIVSYKNRETILAVPDIEDNCLEQYKNGCGENCFSLTQKTIEGDHVIDSEIFKDIKKFVAESDCMDTYNTNDFYDDILVSVFCVANLDKGAFRNSFGAPPTPHIDLNEIYTAFYNYGGLLPGRKQQPQAQSEDTDKNNSNNFRNALSNLLSKINYYITEENPKIDNFFDNDDVPEPFKLKGNDDDDSIKQRVTKSSEPELQSLVLQLETKPHRIGILEKIENSNAVTTIGTLEFIDKISKYQLTNTICMGDYKSEPDEE